MLTLFKKAMLKTIDKNFLDYKIEAYNLSGITGDDNGLIVSLTSFPERIEEVHYTIYSLLTQTIKPAKVVLWLANEEFPNLEKDIERLLKLRKNGLSIEWCNNIYSYKKLIPSLKKYPNNDIVTADDDIYYESEWLKKLIDSRNDNPNCIICHRAHRIKIYKNEIDSYKKWRKKIKAQKASFLNFLTGAGGVLYPANCFYKDILNEKLFMKLAPKADDIWFWAMAILNKTKIYIAKDYIKELIYINPERERGLTDGLTLFSFNKQGGNDVQLKNVINHYPQITKILQS